MHVESRVHNRRKSTPPSPCGCGRKVERWRWVCSGNLLPTASHSSSLANLIQEELDSWSHMLKYDSVSACSAAW